MPLGATGRPLPPAPVRAAEPPPGTIGLAVIGAHLSGMALNHELTERGATFVRAAETAPAYRLYALPGAPPARPGMVRVASGGGSIAVEVWALTPAAFGDFIAGVPAPLGVGTVSLADGTSVKSFLCEAAGAEGAEDITCFGGWRNYVASKG